MTLNAKTQDALVEMAKDLSMLDLGPLLEELDAVEQIGTAAAPVRFKSRAKQEAFYKMVVAFHAARGAVEIFRKAHLAEIEKERQGWHNTGDVPISAMESVFQSELARVDGLESHDIEARRAS